ncbi:hypothetical protein Q5424_25690 [Conexibacter sp. JD483]|uniref:hypothetical protein n=1 Tax=unclassified Conexibacter TaxID=2627773 RepID=UPI0027212551|nr:MULTISPECIES: hypothetical protein [unclassified Conexibacter]MDO8189083.1 hypothetical protein [Conexibacter sp. CPCC 205706]MDO8201870.1 hypothetical protein [Conexibacter sp. CPCC 205762]MDR9372517.1 hypothetical protein [Conexibacter sp. JD483]
MTTAPAQDQERGSLLDTLLGNPLVGLAPWIVYSLVEGEGRLELSAAVALGIALVLLVLNKLRGGSPKLLEFSDVVFFATLAIVVAVSSDGTHAWLERWSGEVVNIALVVIAAGSIAVRNPFTLAYAKEDAPREIWDNPAFLRTNYVITWAWAIAFAIGAASGFYGDLVLDNSNNIWTGWIVQTLPLIVAAQFTLWYPRRVEALGDISRGEQATVPSVSEFLVQVTPWITAIGVIVLVTDAGPGWLGVAFIIVGGVLTGRFKSASSRAQASAAAPAASA